MTLAPTGSATLPDTLVPPSVGTDTPRTEDTRLLRGEGRFVADLVDAGTPQVVFVRSSVAAGRLVAVDVDRARAAPGVLAVVTGADLEEVLGPLPVLHTPDPDFVAATGFRMDPPTVRALAIETVRYVGEPVAAVVGVDRRAAEDAAELVVVEVDELPALVAVDDALAPDARTVDPATPGNRAATIRFARGEVPAAIPEGGVRVTGRYRMGRHTGVPLECRGTVAAYDVHADRVELWTSTQVPFLVQRAICTATGWDATRVRVATPDVGGGFGPKANIYVEDLVVAVLARRLRTRIAWLEDRTEHLLAAAHARDQVHDTELTVDADGRIVSFVDRFTVDLGAHNPWVAGVLANSAIHLHGAYRLPAFDVDGTAVLTNKTPSSQYRGAGRPEACFALERSLDAAAAATGLDPVEIRRRNLLGADELPYEVGLPYRDGVPIALDFVDPGATLERAAAAVRERPVPSAEGRRVGTGVACFVEATGRGPFETARVRVGPAGDLHVHTGAASAGQGHETTLAQIAADRLGVAPDAVHVREGDTDLVPDGMGSFASRTAVVAGNAVALAATELAATATAAVAALLDVDEEEVHLAVDGFVAGDRRVTWPELAAAYARGGPFADRSPLDVVRRYEPSTVTWTCGTHAAVVEVDDVSGQVRVLRYVCVDEGGISINPRIVDGQVRGGVAQGIGGALLEELAYGEAGEPLATTFADYLLPSSLDLPTLEIHHVTHPSRLNPLGVRGVGESGTIAVYAALAAAIDDALGGGVHLDRTPMTPRRVAEAAYAAELRRTSPSTAEVGP